MGTYSILDKDIIFDTGLLKNLFRSSRPENDESFLRSLFEHNHYTSNDYFVMAMPSMIFECLGFKRQDLSKIWDNQSLSIEILAAYKSNELNIDKMLAVAHEAIQNHLLNLGIFSRVELLRRLDFEMQYSSPFGKSLLTSIFRSNLEDINYEEETFPRLAFTLMSEFDFCKMDLPQERVDEIHSHLLMMYRHMILSGYAGYNHAKYIDALIVDKTSDMTSTFKTFQEIVDADIVHSSIFGSSQQGFLNSTATFTMEKISSWDKKVDRYIRGMHDLLVEENFLISPGFIFQVDSYGRIVDHLNVYGSYRSELSSFRYKQDLWLAD